MKIPRPLLLLALCAGLAGPGPRGAATPLPERSLPADPVVHGPWRSPAAERGAAHPGRSGPLTPQERELAQTAWRYFRNNTQSSTGLVNAVDRYPSTTLWDVGSSVAGVTAAEGLGLIGGDEATSRLGAMLDTLGRVGLYRGRCPNKVYNTITGDKVDYANNPGEIGCSAIDVGRLLVWMHIVEQRYPSLKPRVRAAVAHWGVASLVGHGVLLGATTNGQGETIAVQEGRLGYEEYAAKAFRIWGFDASEAAKPEPYGLVTLYGVRVPYDSRDPRLLGAHNYVVSEGALLDGVEFGWNEPDDLSSDPFAHRVGWYASVADAIYRAQEARHARTGVLTARTEHQLATPPYFVYDTLFSDGRPWNTITDDGRVVPEAAAVSTKAAIGLWALWRTPYTDTLFAAARGLEDAGRGLREGRLESGGPIESFTANTNGIILECLLYKVQGRLHRPAPPESLAPPEASVAPPPPKPAAATPPPSPLVAAVPPKPRAAESPAPPSAGTGPASAGTGSESPPVRRGPLTAGEMEAARVAWRYFVNNTQPGTGLVNAVDDYHSTTLWDTAAALGAIVSARELGIIDTAEARARLRQVVATLGALRLFHGQCPNKAYDTLSLAPTDYSDRPAQNGCSALDAGRILIWMRIVWNRFPDLRPDVEQAVAHWNIATLVRGGELWGATTRDGRTVFRQEGRLGYEQYAAKGFELWGQATPVAAGHGAAEMSSIEGISIAHDRRNGANSGGHNPVLTEPYALDGLEFGWARPDGGAPDAWTLAAARAIYQVQEARYARTGVLTARSEHQLLASPHFVYDTIYSDGVPWATVDAAGRPVRGAAAVSTKAAFGLWALWETPYTDRLLEGVLHARDPARGFYEGLFETGGDLRAYTANNNGVILEALCFKAKGPLTRMAPFAGGA